MLNQEYLSNRTLHQFPKNSYCCSKARPAGKDHQALSSNLKIKNIYYCWDKTSETQKYNSSTTSQGRRFEVTNKINNKLITLKTFYS